MNNIVKDRKGHNIVNDSFYSYLLNCMCQQGLSSFCREVNF